MGDYKKYDSNPLKLLWDTKKETMATYLWVIWCMMAFLLFIGACFNWIDLSNIDSSSFIDLSVSGLSFTLVIVSAALEVYHTDDLVILLKAKNEEEVNGYYFLQLLTPYLFTATIYLIIGMISIVSPLITISFTSGVIKIFNYMFIMLQLLGVFSLFNITYTILIELYNSTVRSKLIEDEIDKLEGE